MTNLEKIRAMSAEELVLNYHSARPCKVCSYFEDDECSLKGYAGERECNGGRIKWLNSEANPFPALEIGDVITLKPEGVGYSDEAIYIGDGYIAQAFIRSKRPLKKENVYKVWRHNGPEGGYSMIWRADDEEH